jgi:hypothetical protein
MKPFALSVALALFASAPVAFAAGGGNNPTPTKKAPADVINGLLTKYDANHDGKFDKKELDMMATLEPAKAAQGRVFDADKNSILSVEEIAKWREFLKLSK